MRTVLLVSKFNAHYSVFMDIIMQFCKFEEKITIKLNSSRYKFQEWKCCLIC